MATSARKNTLGEPIQPTDNAPQRPPSILLRERRTVVLQKPSGLLCLLCAQYVPELPQHTRQCLSAANKPLVLRPPFLGQSQWQSVSRQAGTVDAPPPPKRYFMPLLSQVRTSASLRSR